MLKIRLNRVGRKHDPSYRLVVTDSRKAPQAGGYLENLGSCDFRKDRFELKEDRIKYWVSRGAQASDTVHNILVSEKIVEGKKKDVSSRRKRKKKAGAEKVEKTVEAEASAEEKSVKKDEERPEEKPEEKEKKPLAEMS